MSNKRTGKKTNKPNNGNSSILKTGAVTVQRLSSDVQGKAQKYARMGPREFVPFPYETVTIKNLKEACYRHFKSRIDENMVCDILAGDQDPSCSLLEQIPNFNVIHVRFVVATNDSWEADSSYPSINSTARVPSHKKRSREETTSFPNPKFRAKETSTFPKSLSVLEMNSWEICHRCAKILLAAEHKMQLAYYLRNTVWFQRCSEFGFFDEPFIILFTIFY